MQRGRQAWCGASPLLLKTPHNLLGRKVPGDERVVSLFDPTDVNFGDRQILLGLLEGTPLAYKELLLWGVMVFFT